MRALRNSLSSPAAPLVAFLIMLGVLAPLLMAPTGGFPSRPQFQAVGVNIAAPSTPGRVRADGATPEYRVSRATGTASDWSIYLPAASTDIRFGNNLSGRDLVTVSGAALTFGNATDNPTYTFAGSGTTAFAGNVTVGGSSVCRADGTNCPAAQLVANKTADTARTSTVTLANDPDLQLTLVTGKRYALQGYLRFVCTAAAGQGYRTSLVMSTGAAGATSGVSNYDSTGVVAGENPFATNTVGSNCDTSTNVRQFNGFVDVTTGGTFAIQWAQQTSNGNSTVLKAGSWVRATQLN